MANRLRIAVVGLGSIGKRHLRLLLERPDLQMEICELNSELRESAVNEFHPARCYWEFEEMLSAKPDVVWLATPTALHAKQSIAALRAGTHVFCEKPMTDSVSDAGKVCREARKTGRIFNVGFHLHFHPAIRRMKDLVTSGTLGNVLHLHARVGTYQTLLCSVSRHQAHKTGALVWDYAHQPDLFYWLTGQMPRSVFAAGFRGGNLELSSTPNILDVICEYDSPLLTSIHLNYIQAPERHEYEIVGDKGWCILDLNGGLLKIGFSHDGTTKTESFAIQRDDIYRAEHEAFFQALEGKRTPETPCTNGMKSVLVCQAAIRSWQKGRKEKIISPPLLV